MTQDNTELKNFSKTDLVKQKEEVLIMDDHEASSENSKIAPKQKKSNKNTRPGRLAGSVPFEIHTADAELLFSGHSVKDAVSLLQFGGQMTKIWDAAEGDDPYADWYLLKIYDGIVKCRNQLGLSIQNYQTKIHQTYGRSNLRPTPFTSQKPVVKSLWFRTQYGYLGASIIAEFDELMRTVLTANRIGILLDQSHTEIKEAWNSKIVTLFKFPFKWHPLNITRSEVETNHELLEKAENLMGKCPAEVLTKTLRSPFAPIIKNTKKIDQQELNMDKNT